MKKYAIITSVILTLAGCSASIAIADLQDASVTPSTTIVKETVSKVEPFSAQQLIREAKIERNTDKMQDVVEYLKTRVGVTSYVFSGSSPYGWDCSGLVRWAYERFGLELPHSANKQGHVGTRVSEPKLGDIVVFAYQNSTDFYHAAIYIGNGLIVHANQARGTTVIEPLSNYKNSQIRFVRVVETQ
jgi:cell wall-associated NlpC family hydrolase